MNRALKVMRYQVVDLVRGRALVGYALFFVAITASLTYFGGGVARALPSLATMILLIVPLVSLLMATTTIYNRGDFVNLLLTHPVGRRPVFIGLHLGVTLPLMAAFLIGVLTPLLLSGGASEHLGAIAILAGAGVLLTGVFASIGMAVALYFDRMARGSGFALLLWLALVVLYDGLVLFAAYRWAAYPMEGPMLALMALNPVDLARVMVLVALDASALMGYTGAVFQDFFGGTGGLVLAAACLSAWIAGPTLAAMRLFERKNL
jgi:Cu-processing system permease protein